MNKDDAYKEFEDYCETIESYLSEPLNEADTRAKFIDKFLINILGWPEAEIRRELTYVDDGERKAIDYIVGRDSPILVIEAKKSCLEFELPSDTKDSFLYSLDGVVKSCPNLYAAITQGRTYCDDRGVPFAIITNGKQFGLFRAVTEGTMKGVNRQLLTNMKGVNRQLLTKVDTRCDNMKGVNRQLLTKVDTR